MTRCECRCLAGFVYLFVYCVDLFFFFDRVGAHAFKCERYRFLEERPLRFGIGDGLLVLACQLEGIADRENAKPDCLNDDLGCHGFTAARPLSVAEKSTPPVFHRHVDSFGS